ncbi:transporter substrate-binding domain-containing protein [Paenibacillaceae bacterium WGS1546]|uniref:transporter substrate-binding domain-containing protein n=1 Tax=Cohnella sp. WGS1546 TaxID=3366810 RepID=UPI00372D817D
MKMNRKFRFATIAFVMAIALVGCGAKGNNGEASNGADGGAASGEQTAAPGNLLEQVKQSGVLKVGLMGTYAPYNFMNENKEIDGYDADIAKEVGKRIGVEIEFVAQEFSGMIAGLQAEKFDAVVSQMTITDERKEQMDFSQPYITNQVKIIVGESNDEITKLEDFKGKNIGVGLGTNDETYLRTQVLPEVGDFTIRTYDDVITTLKDLDVGRVDATINNLYALKPVVEKNGYRIKAVGEPIKSDRAGIAIRKGNPELLEAIDQALTDMKADGTHAEIFMKWFGEEPVE